MGFERISLGRTGLMVTRLGIGSSYGTDAAMVEEAAAHGINYFYWGALRTKRMAEGIKNVASKKRDDMVIVSQTNARTRSGISKVVQRSLKRLGVDYLDVLLLGGHNKKPADRLIEQAAKLKEQGLIRFLAISGHNRKLFPELEKDKHFDIFHIRYNAAHRGAEKEVFEHIPEEGSSGIVSFTNTRWGGLINPRNMPPGEETPSAADCYRFVLSHPKVHVAVCAPNSMKQLKEDLRTLELGPLSEEETERMCRIGDYVYKNTKLYMDQIRGMMTIKWRQPK
ncbi:MAG: aldo/keto reductase [Deltaproteobacteria bacterium]|nr:MAG: aldo/keto reductase [Deltaproteobacteria bacterium]